MKYHITHEKNGIYHGLLVEARSQEVAEAYFKELEPENRLLGIHEARAEDMKPGKPMMVVPDAYGKIEILIGPGPLVFAEENYLEGMVTVNGNPYPFDYNIQTGEIEVHSFSTPGWLTGSSYEKPLPEIILNNIEEIDLVICEAVDAFLEKVNGTLDGKLADARAAAAETEQVQDSFEKDYTL